MALSGGRSDRQWGPARHRSAGCWGQHDWKEPRDLDVLLVGQGASSGEKAPVIRRRRVAAAATLPEGRETVLYRTPDPASARKCQQA
jgi:hypothetical protein